MLDTSSELQSVQQNGQSNQNSLLNASPEGKKELDSDAEPTRNFYELSCNILSLSFLEDEEEIYSMEDLKEKY